MSNRHLDEAKKAGDYADEHDSDYSRAQAFALIAVAEALERIVDRLDSLDGLLSERGGR